MWRYDTMVPAANVLCRSHVDGYGGCSGRTHLEFYNQQMYPIAPGVMAEDDTRSGAGKDEEEGDEGEGEVGTSGSTRGSGEGEEGVAWLQLGIGVGAGAGGSSSSHPTRLVVDVGGGLLAERGSSSTPRRRGGTSLELDLFYGTGQAENRTASSGTATAGMMMMPLYGTVHAGALRRETSAYRRYPMVPPDMTRGGWNVGPSVGVRPQTLPYGSSQFMCMPGLSMTAGEGGGHGQYCYAAGGVRVVSPPARPQAGVWFVLQAAQNQGKEPFLPQIRKSYLRIKDGRMTVRLLMKYLVNKLALEDDSEVEITCRGHPLPPLQTLQHVRDRIWCSRDTPLPLDSPGDHVMMLHYGRPT